MDRRLRSACHLVHFGLWTSALILFVGYFVRPAGWWSVEEIIGNVTKESWGDNTI